DDLQEKSVTSSKKKKKKTGKQSQPKSDNVEGKQSQPKSDNVEGKQSQPKSDNVEGKQTEEKKQHSPSSSTSTPSLTQNLCTKQTHAQRRFDDPTDDDDELIDNDVYRQKVEFGAHITQVNIIDLEYEPDNPYQNQFKSFINEEIL
ncbi:unnamed protein product, partial [Didymodactylos carnosus]